MIEIMAALVGVNFRGREAIARVKELTIGEKVSLEAEPSNPYDVNAVKVITEDGVFVGYISKESNSETAAHLAEEGECECEVISFLAPTKPHLSITLLSDEDDEEA